MARALVMRLYAGRVPKVSPLNRGGGGGLNLVTLDPLYEPPLTFYKF